MFGLTLEESHEFVVSHICQTYLFMMSDSTQSVILVFLDQRHVAISLGTAEMGLSIRSRKLFSPLRIHTHTLPPARGSRVANSVLLGARVVSCPSPGLCRTQDINLIPRLSPLRLDYGDIRVPVSPVLGCLAGGKCSGKYAGFD